jgi:hypothetical protein
MQRRFVCIYCCYPIKDNKWDENSNDGCISDMENLNTISYVCTFVLESIP